MGYRSGLHADDVWFQAWHGLLDFFLCNPPFYRGGHTHTVHGLPLPIDALEFIVLSEAKFPESAKDSRFYPRLEMGVRY